MLSFDLKILLWSITREGNFAEKNIINIWNSNNPADFVASVDTGTASGAVCVITLANPSSRGIMSWREANGFLFPVPFVNIFQSETYVKEALAMAMFYKKNYNVSIKRHKMK